ncbi:J domain-containing protein [Parendozoicomonas haliclonae]|uniref:Chaperone protein DnaJ n=1 Tax=Parendozoicomonas haliclonae TaxID=1960125 RepID=A0A1X7AMZ9_9GAMM|nr:J domain-containing protein [Parendozoicomonas haliclonae]SMA49510.1 Chaperone protein DnaJ [Parendozoicomonas haliclonae]
MFGNLFGPAFVGGARRAPQMFRAASAYSPMGQPAFFGRPAFIVIDVPASHFGCSCHATSTPRQSAFRKVDPFMSFGFNSFGFNSYGFQAPRPAFQAPVEPAFNIFDLLMGISLLDELVMDGGCFEMPGFTAQPKREQASQKPSPQQEKAQSRAKPQAEPRAEQEAPKAESSQKAKEEQKPEGSKSQESKSEESKPKGKPFNFFEEFYGFRPGRGFTPPPPRQEQNGPQIPTKVDSPEVIDSALKAFKLSSDTLSSDNLKKAWRKIALKNHPDMVKQRGGSAKDIADAEERFKKLNEQRAVLDRLIEVD